VTPTTPVYIAGFVVIAALALLRARLERSGGARALFRFAGGLEIAWVALLLAALIGLGAVQIFLRNAFHSGLLWADPLMRHIVLWLGALGAALASGRMRHITVDALSLVLPTSWKGARRVVVYGATAVAAYLLAVSATRLVIDERSFGETAFLGLKTWTVQLVLPACFALIAYRALVAIFLKREPAGAGMGE
jgi:TRAP-type C4-dicarboxylate transport system permease small subunit